MKRIGIGGLMLLAACAAALALSASAFAANQPEILPTTAAEYKGVNVGIAKLSTLAGGAAAVVECKTAAGKGTLAAGGTSGTFKIEFKECKSSAGVCTGLGEAAGVILSTGTYKTVFDKVTELHGVLGSAILFEPEGENHFNCTALVLVLVKGQVLCLILAPEPIALSHEFHCTSSTLGDPNETEYFKTLNAEKKFGAGTKITELLSSTNGATPNMAAEEALGTMVFPVEVVVMN